MGPFTCRTADWLIVGTLVVFKSWAWQEDANRGLSVFAAYEMIFFVVVIDIVAFALRQLG